MTKMFDFSTTDVHRCRRP